MDLLVHLLGTMHLGFPRARLQNEDFIGGRNPSGVLFTST